MEIHRKEVWTCIGSNNIPKSLHIENVSRFDLTLLVRSKNIQSCVHKGTYDVLEKILLIDVRPYVRPENSDCVGVDQLIVCP